MLILPAKYRTGPEPGEMYEQAKAKSTDPVEGFCISPLHPDDLPRRFWRKEKARKPVCPGCEKMGKAMHKEATEKGTTGMDRIIQASGVTSGNRPVTFTKHAGRA